MLLFMNAQILDKLTKLGAIEQLPTGVPGVRVSLQYEPRLSLQSRDARRDLLRHEFERIAHALGAQGAKLDLDSVSVSGQTVEAIFPLDNYDRISQELSNQQIRVDLLIDRQIVRAVSSKTYFGSVLKFSWQNHHLSWKWSPQTSWTRRSLRPSV